MRFSDIKGLIRRRLLLNYRVDPAIIQKQLPAPFRPKLHGDYSIAGVCLIRLEQMRPRIAPSILGVSSENAAHRIAVTWEDDAGLHDGVYIPRRDTSAWVNRIAGGRLFPGEHHAATFQVIEQDNHIDFRMQSQDQLVRVELSGKLTDEISTDSCFRSLHNASKFFETGSVGYSVTTDKQRLDGIRLTTDEWKVEPLSVERVYSSYFSDSNLFPPGSAVFDCALIMRNVRHAWHSESEIHVNSEVI